MYYDEENLKVVHASTLQKIAEQVKALTKQAQTENLGQDTMDALMDGFLLNFNKLLVLQTDAVMTGAIKAKIIALVDTCLGNLEDLAESGAHCAGACGKLKDACIYFLRRQQEETACKVVGIFKHIAFQHKDLRAYILDVLGMLSGVAMKSGLRHLGLECADVIIASMHNLQPGEEADEEAALKMLQCIANVAARMRDEANFEAVVLKVTQHYTKEKRVLVGSHILGFLLELLFTAADRRYLSVLPKLRELSLLLVHHSDISLQEKERFLSEWSVLAAQIARRDWPDVTKLLLDSICIFLRHERSSALTQAVMLNFTTHIQMHSQWGGFAVAFYTYRSWNNFTLVLLEQCVNDRHQDEECLDLAKCIFRCQREVVVNSARLTMKEEQTIFKEWLNLWLEQVQGNASRIKRVRRFVQMTAQFWHMTQPISSKKQWPLMQELFNPPSIPQKYWQLLKRIV